MILRRSLFSLLLLAFLPPFACAADPQPQWIVVTAPAFRDAIKPLCDHRKSQGMNVVVVETGEALTAKDVLAGDPAKLCDHVRKLCKDAKGPCYVVLVGAVEPGKLEQPEKKVLPPLAGTVGRMKGQPSDNAYGCTDDGLMPTVAVGRLPARSVQEVEHMVAKIINHERDTMPGRWKRQLTILAGIPAFNPFVDGMVERLAIARFDKIDPSWSGRAIYHNAGSRFCVPDDKLRTKAVDTVCQGQCLTLYLGHSDASGFWADRAQYMDRDDWASVKVSRGAGVLATFGCLGCQLKGKDGEGYGVAAIRNPHGPVAVLGSHGVCFAAMVQLAADGLFEGMFQGKPPSRIGDVFLKVKAGVDHGKIDAVTFNLLDTVDGDSRIPQAVQRKEHLEMFLLLGDPALKLPEVDDMPLTVIGDVGAGKAITVQGQAAEKLAGASVRITVERPPSSVPADLEPLPKDVKQRDKVMLANYEKANRFVVTETEATVRDGRFEAKLELPAKLPWGRLIIRAYAATEKHEAQGVLAVKTGE